MKTQIVPAQITTVEDKIVGNLNLIQLFLLLSPVVALAIVYALFPPAMEVVIYKIAVTMFFSIIAIVLSLRIKEKVVIEWLKILVSYNLRPKYFVYNKNESFDRETDFSKEKIAKKTQKKIVKQEQSIVDFKIKELVSFEDLISQQTADFRISSSKKGGINVAFDQIKR